MQTNNVTLRFRTIVGDANAGQWRVNRRHPDARPSTHLSHAQTRRVVVRQVPQLTAALPRQTVRNETHRSRRVGLCRRRHRGMQQQVTPHPRTLSTVSTHGSQFDVGKNTHAQTQAHGWAHKHTHEPPSQHSQTSTTESQTHTPHIFTHIHTLPTRSTTNRPINTTHSHMHAHIHIVTQTPSQRRRSEAGHAK